MPFEPLKFLINQVKTAVGNLANLSTPQPDVVTALNAHTSQIVNLGNALAYVINGNTYSGSTIPSGSFVLWNGVLYTANGAIPAGSVSASNFSNLPETGGLNAINNKLTPVSIPITWKSENATPQGVTSRLVICGDIAILHISATCTTTSTSWNVIGNFNVDYAPSLDSFCLLWNHSALPAVPVPTSIGTIGTISINGTFNNVLIRGTLVWVVKH